MTLLLVFLLSIVFSSTHANTKLNRALGFILFYIIVPHSV